MKLKLFVLCFAAMIMFSSCQSSFRIDDTSSVKINDQIIKNTLTEDQVRMIYSDEAPDIKMNTGYFNTSLDLVDELTSFKSPVEVDQFVTAPLIDQQQNYTHILRLFPETIPDGPDTYNEWVMSGEKMPLKIEVFQNYDYSEVVKTIELKGFEDRDVRFWTLKINTDGSYTILGNHTWDGKDYVVSIYRISADGRIEKEIPIDFDVVQETQYMLCFDDIYVCKDQILTRTNYFIDNTIKIAENVLAFTIQENKLYFITEDLDDNLDYIYYLYEYDINDASNLQIGSIDIEHNINTFIYDKDEKICYFDDSSSLYAYSFEDQESVRIGKVLLSNLNICNTSDDVITFRIGHSQIVSYRIPETLSSIDQNRICLRVCAADMDDGQFENHMYRVLETLETNGISIDIEVIYHGDSLSSQEYMNTMSKKLLASDSDFDLFVTSTRMTDILKDGYYQDLSQYPALNRYYELMTPGAKALCTIEKKCVLVPMSLNTSANFINNTLSAGKISEIPQTLEQFPDYITDAPIIPGAYFTEHLSLTSIMYPFLEQYTANFMSKCFDDETFLLDLKNIFRIGSEIKKNEKININQALTVVNGRTDHSLFYFSDINSRHSDENETAYSPIKVDENYKYPFDCDYLAINPYSDNKDVAAIFLLYYLELNRKESGFYQSDSNEDDLYQKLLEDSIVNYTITGFPMYVHDIFDKMEEGIIDPETAAEETFRYLKMIRDE